jgi:hypothetical protein
LDVGVVDVGVADVGVADVGTDLVVLVRVEGGSVVRVTLVGSPLDVAPGVALDGALDGRVHRGLDGDVGAVFVRVATATVRPPWPGQACAPVASTTPAATTPVSTRVAPPDQSRRRRTIRCTITPEDSSGRMNRPWAGKGDPLMTERLTGPTRRQGLSVR